MLTGGSSVTLSCWQYLDGKFVDFSTWADQVAPVRFCQAYVVPIRSANRALQTESGTAGLYVPFDEREAARQQVPRMSYRGMPHGICVAFVRSIFYDTESIEFLGQRLLPSSTFPSRPASSTHHGAYLVCAH